MRYSSISLAGLLAILPAVSALTFTSPSPGTTIDPTQSIVISWTSTSGDPSVIELRIDNANPNSVTTDLTIAASIATASGSYTVPPNTIQNFGTGYQIQAISNGNIIAQVSSLSLGAGQNQVTTVGNGQLSFVSETTGIVTSTVASLPASGGASGSGTISAAATTGSPSSATVLSGTATGSAASAKSSEASSTGSQGFVTSSTSRSSSGSSAAATSAANTNTANGQMRLGGEVVLSAAGVLAGMVALLA